MSAWAVIAVCASLQGQCFYVPPVGLPSSVACAAHGRNVQLARGLPMNEFKCVKAGEPHG